MRLEEVKSLDKVGSYTGMGQVFEIQSYSLEQARFLRVGVTEQRKALRFRLGASTPNYQHTISAGLGVKKGSSLDQRM